MSGQTIRSDYLIVGAGLQGCLLALAIRHRQPRASIVLVDQSDCPGGNHTWSFHESDLPGESWKWLGDVPHYRWDSYSVHFPGFQRSVDLPYRTIQSGELANWVLERWEEEENSCFYPRCVIESIDGNSATTGEKCFEAGAVLDCRGFNRQSCSLNETGFQTFYGLNVSLLRDWHEAKPRLMDVPVDQSNGFQFMYVLPFHPNRILIEDTRFSTDPVVDVAASQVQIDRYLSRSGHGDYEVESSEQGCLPMPWKSRLGSSLAAGYRGGFFHPATGYSMPLAVSLAESVAAVRPAEAALAIADLRRSHRRRFWFSRFLNRMLFRLVEPQSRIQVFDNFYRLLPESTIARFYAHRFTVPDAARILLGKPPGQLTPLQFVRSIRG